MSADGPEKITYFRDNVLDGRVVLVTGGGSGIGFEISRQFGLHGAKGVVIMGRRQKFLDEAVGMLKSEGIQAMAVAGDVRKPEDCSSAVKAATDAFGSLDVLINAAAGNFLAVAEQLSPNGFKTVMDIDTLGTYNMTHMAFPALKASKFGGIVTSVTATLHRTATWYQTAPVAAKAAIEAFTRNLALEWGEYGIRCNCVAPGPVQGTPGLEKLSGGQGKTMKFPWIPLQRAATKAEIASTCIFLCVHGYITGQIIDVDGGEWFGKVPLLPKDAISKISRGVEGSSRSMGANSKL